MIKISLSSIEFNDISYKNRFEFATIASKYDINNIALARIMSKVKSNNELTDKEKRAIIFIQQHCICTYSTEYEKIQVQQFANALGIRVNYITDIVKLFGKS